jgi:hypothetical protein
MSDFSNLGIVGKLVLPIFQRYRPCTEASLGSQDMILRTEAVGMFLMPRGHLLTEIPVQPEELLTIRKLRAVAEVNLLPKGLGSWTKLQWVGESLWLSVGPFFRSFDHNFLVSCPFWARKVSNRSSHYVLQNGPGAVSSIQLSVWSTVRSNLGQTWSILVEFGQNSPNSGKCIPGRVSRVFGPDGP